MRILHLISSGGMYGAEAVILNLCLALNASGQHEGLIGVFANSTHPNLALHEAARRVDVTSYVVSMHRSIRFSGYPLPFANSSDVRGLMSCIRTDTKLISMLGALFAGHLFL